MQKFPYGHINSSLVCAFDARRMHLVASPIFNTRHNSKSCTTSVVVANRNRPPPHHRDTKWSIPGPTCSVAATKLLRRRPRRRIPASRRVATPRVTSVHSSHLVARDLVGTRAGTVFEVRAKHIYGTAVRTMLRLLIHNLWHSAEWAYSRLHRHAPTRSCVRVMIRPCPRPHSR